MKSFGTFMKWLLWMELGQTEARNLELLPGFPPGSQEPKCLGLLPSQEQERIARSQTNTNYLMPALLTAVNTGPWLYV